MFSSTAGYGHVLPMLPLAVSARERGHDVLWATAAEACPLIQEEGAAAAPAGVSAESCLAEYARRWPEAASEQRHRLVVSTLLRLGEPALPALRAALDDPNDAVRGGALQALAGLYDGV